MSGLTRRRIRVAVAAAVAAVLLGPSSAASQERSTRFLQVSRDDGTSFELTIREDRGYAVISDAGLTRLGWNVQIGPRGIDASYGGRTVSLGLDTPFFQWDADLLQFVRPPYAENGTIWVPVQFFLDFLPARMPERYAVTAQGTLAVTTGYVIVSERGGADTPESALGVADAPESNDVEAETTDTTGLTPEQVQASSDAEELEGAGADSGAGVGAASEDGGETEPDPTWGLVVIDPGHGGRDPGAIGPGGRREKDIALSIGRALARELGRREGLEVRMTRDRDQLIPLWERGHLATEWKRDRPAIFISIHANSLPDRSSVRGFETYFLSEARTEHEARVAENENAPLALRGDPVAEGEATPGLEFILRELRNRDHQRWSSVLAEEVQRGMEAVHPGPNRGVKQAPFAVITNALMPAVLVEVGFVTNPNEERVLSRGEFQRDLAASIATAIDRFFERYPGAGASGGRRP